MSMKRLQIVMLLCLSLLTSLLLESCRGMHDVRFSILGDSYSAFTDYVHPDTNEVWYRLPPDNVSDVTEIGDVWWYQVATAMQWKLDVNNSFSGAPICNSGNGNYGTHSFVRRMDDLGKPDVIFVFGGTNDVWYQVPLGDFVYDNWSDEQLRAFRPALACVFSNLKAQHPKATIYFLLDMRLGERHRILDERSEEFKSSIREIASHYGIVCIELHDISKKWSHPDKEGQARIATQVVETLKARRD